MERAARHMVCAALVLFAVFLAALTAQALLAASLFDQQFNRHFHFDFEQQYWGAMAAAGICLGLFTLDLTALVLTLRGRRLLAQYRRERDDLREAREAQGPLLGRR